LWFSIPIALLAVAGSLVGFFSDTIYAKETGYLLFLIEESTLMSRRFIATT
jgi:hypothetical protein